MIWQGLKRQLAADRAPVLLPVAAIGMSRTQGITKPEAGKATTAESPAASLLKKWAVNSRSLQKEGEAAVNSLSLQ